MFTYRFYIKPFFNYVNNYKEGLKFPGQLEEVEVEEELDLLGLYF